MPAPENMWIGYTCTEDKNGKKHYDKMGVMFVHEDSISVKLVGNPVNGELVFFKPKTEPEGVPAQA